MHFWVSAMFLLGVVLSVCCVSLATSQSAVLLQARQCAVQERHPLHLASHEITGFYHPQEGVLPLDTQGRLPPATVALSRRLLQTEADRSLRDTREAEELQSRLYNIADLQYELIVTLGTPSSPSPSLEGDPQVQYVTVIPDTGSADFWVPGVECTNCGAAHTYDPLKSKTAKRVGDQKLMQYGDGTVARGETWIETARIPLGNPVREMGLRVGAGNETMRVSTDIPTETAAPSSLASSSASLWGVEGPESEKTTATSLEVQNQLVVVLVAYTSRNVKMESDGILGLARFQEGTERGEREVCFIDNFFQQQKDAGLKPQFSLYLNYLKKQNQRKETETEGDLSEKDKNNESPPAAMFFGEADLGTFVKEETRLLAPMGTSETSHLWNVKVKAVGVAGQERLRLPSDAHKKEGKGSGGGEGGEGVPMMVDSGSSMLVLEEPVYEYVVRGLERSGVCGRTSRGVFCQCPSLSERHSMFVRFLSGDWRSFPTLDFEVEELQQEEGKEQGGGRFCLDASEYVIEIVTSSGVCVGQLAIDKGPSTMPVPGILGMVMMRSFVTTFDGERRAVGIARSRASPLAGMRGAECGVTPQLTSAGIFGWCVLSFLLVLMAAGLSWLFLPFCLRRAGRSSGESREVEASELEGISGEGNRFDMWLRWLRGSVRETPPESPRVPLNNAETEGSEMREVVG
uniref:Peptidase A1 domain-containing protein n=1 Tax=Chromera velia CCMP2878 TaxID=1169474 RepID=A0A0G4H7U6_9ALVE|eukprot:Cvel_5856.t1-p1 / transcript=Cvel_5856.t1 / gene=Cvel_5856 / organism=Chromera_velia_CCMP2878 / gene_product=Syncephapepsin, putative / transcript_product=Syncephapepsin, putative / location=Cvel_scaffold278:72366-78171(+) / protein_length=686 / sequence_SO=supercontig / SO=protein_coding / is_pseudo=false